MASVDMDGRPTNIDKPGKGLQQVVHEIRRDLYRRTNGHVGLKQFIRCYFIYHGFRYVVLIRLSKYFKNHPVLRYFLYCPVRLMAFLCGSKYGIDIPLSVDIGSGLRIEHFGGIFLSARTVIGKNCNILNNVTFGYLPRGIHKGTPISVGNNVYIGPGAKILGKITVGNNVVIGANTVVTKNVPDNCTVFGIPGRVVSREGSVDYVDDVVECVV